MGLLENSPSQSLKTSHLSNFQLYWKHCEILNSSNPWNRVEDLTDKLEEGKGLGNSYGMQ